jgi:D-3-phosphoglycerate dehydrogenase
MFRVMVRDNMSTVSKEILEASGKIEVVVDNNAATSHPKALSEIIGKFHGLAVRSGTKVTKEVLKNAKNLKVIGRAGIGVDNIDVQAATKQGVVVMNAPGGNTITTAEHTVSLMLALARNIPQGTASLREGKWEKKRLSGVEITGKTLGIIGLGHVGRVVADRAKGLKMAVIASDPYVSSKASKSLKVELVPLDELFLRSDFITLHVPHLKETVGMINETTINKMKQGVRIINCSRGEVVIIDDLYQAILSGHVAGAALDVLPQEPPEPNLPILQHPNVIFTPHLGASTGEAQEKVAGMIADQMTAYLLDGIITNAVNFPSLPMEVMDQLRPYLDLTEKMGSLMGQLVRKIHDITISYSGIVSDLDTRPLTHAALKGLLGSFTDKPVNYVNAPALAQDKGIRVNETISSTKHDFTSLIRMKLEGNAGEIDEIWGTIYEQRYPRLVKIGEIYLDAIPEGWMIVIQNIDKPGVIGNVGTTLGRHNINIARFQLGRLGDRAICLVNIDTPADEEVIHDLSKLPNIISVRQVHLE